MNGKSFTLLFSRGFSYDIGLIYLWTKPSRVNTTKKQSQVYLSLTFQLSQTAVVKVDELYFPDRSDQVKPILDGGANLPPPSRFF